MYYIKNQYITKSLFCLCDGNPEANHLWIATEYLAMTEKRVLLRKTLFMYYSYIGMFNLKFMRPTSALNNRRGC